jgi:hypothetical protein
MWEFNVMALETATYIPELTNTNPVGATDPKSAGDDHLRLIKKTLLNTFGAFVGTAGAPKSVTLTEDEINDCAQKLAAATIAGLWDFTTQPTINDDLVAVEPILQNSITDDYELVLGDAGKHIYMPSGAAKTLTIPANVAVAFPIGTAIPVANWSGNDWSIAITTDVMELEGAGTTGTRTLGDHGLATLLKVETALWIIAGGLVLS